MSSSSESEEGELIGVTFKSLAAKEATLTYCVGFLKIKNKDPVAFFKVAEGEDVFCLTGCQTIFEENQFYKIQIKKNFEKKQTQNVLDSKHATFKLWFGKKRYVPSHVDLQKIKSDISNFINCTFGEIEKAPTVDEAIETAKGKKSSALTDCRSFVLRNSKMTRFLNGYIICFDGRTLRILNFDDKSSSFEDVLEDSWYLFKKLAFVQGTVAITPDSSYSKEEHTDDNDKKRLYEKLYNLKHRESGSHCYIGNVIKISTEMYNANGRKYMNGHYLHIRLIERSGKEKDGPDNFRVWSENVKISCDESLIGSLVLLPTNYNRVREDKSTFNALTILKMKTFKPRKRSSTSPQAMSGKAVKTTPRQK